MTIELEYIPLETNALSLRKYCITIKNNLKISKQFIKKF